MAVANQVICVRGTKRAHPTQAVDGFQEAGFTRRVGAGNEIDGGGKRQPGAFDIPKILNIKRQQPDGRVRDWVRRWQDGTVVKQKTGYRRIGMTT